MAQQKPSTDFLGSWIVVNSSLEFDIAFPDGELHVEGLDTRDGEKLEITEAEVSPSGETLTFSFRVPSTGRSLRQLMKRADANTLEGWYTGDAFGRDRWERKGHEISPDMSEPESLPTDTPVIYAFLLMSARSDVNTAVFAHGSVVEDSDDIVKEKIRQNRQSNARVEIIEPEKWNPPDVAEASADAVLAKWAEISAQAHSFLGRNGRNDVDLHKLAKEGIAWPRPRSGRVFCIFEVGSR